MLIEDVIDALESPLGILIAEQHTEKNKAAFVDAKSLVSDYLVDGVPLGDLVGEVCITDYT